MIKKLKAYYGIPYDVPTHSVLTTLCSDARVSSIVPGGLNMAHEDVLHFITTGEYFNPQAIINLVNNIKENKNQSGYLAMFVLYPEIPSLSHNSINFIDTYSTISVRDLVSAPTNNTFSEQMAFIRNTITGYTSDSASLPFIYKLPDLDEDFNDITSTFNLRDNTYYKRAVNMCNAIKKRFNITGKLMPIDVGPVEQIRIEIMNDVNEYLQVLLEHETLQEMLGIDDVEIDLDTAMHILQDVYSEIESVILEIQNSILSGSRDVFTILEYTEAEIDNHTLYKEPVQTITIKNTDKTIDIDFTDFWSEFARSMRCYIISVSLFTLIDNLMTHGHKVITCQKDQEDLKIIILYLFREYIGTGMEEFPNGEKDRTYIDILTKDINNEVRNILGGYHASLL